MTSIDCEGTGDGFDLELTREVAQSVSIPVIASGGAGNIEDIFDVVTQGKADAVSVASILHYNYIRQYYTEDDYSSEGNIEFLRSRLEFSKVESATLEEVKQNLVYRNISCRLEEEMLL